VSLKVTRKPAGGLISPNKIDLFDLKK